MTFRSGDSNPRFSMGTLKCVCSYSSRDITANQLEHTLLRVPIIFPLVIWIFTKDEGDEIKSRQIEIHYKFCCQYPLINYLGISHVKMIGVRNDLAEDDKPVLLSEILGSLLALWYVYSPFVEVFFAIKVRKKSWNQAIAHC